MRGLESGHILGPPTGQASFCEQFQIQLHIGYSFMAEIIVESQKG
jgi:hypothetical protein